MSTVREEPVTVQIDPIEPLRHFPPYYEYLGIQLEEGASVSLLSRPELTNSRGAVHGGAVASLLDAALARAIRGTVPPGTGLATIDMSVHFLTPAVSPSIIAQGKVLRVGGTVAYAEAEAITEEGVVVAHAVGSYRLRRPRDESAG
jgi:uncharacterized protein (TIGR00369 family)